MAHPNLQPFSLLEQSDELVLSLAELGEVDALEARAPVQQLDQPRHGDGARAIPIKPSDADRPGLAGGPGPRR